DATATETVRDLDKKSSGYDKCEHAPGGRSLHRMVRRCGHLSYCRFASVASQCGNLGVLQCKVVAEFSRTSRKGAADLCGDDSLVARMSEVGWVGMWFVGGIGFLNPSFDCVGAVIFASFISYKRISGEKSANGVRIVCVECLKKRRNGWRQFYIHGFVGLLWFVRLSEWFPRR